MSSLVLKLELGHYPPTHTFHASLTGLHNYGWHLICEPLRPVFQIRRGPNPILTIGRRS